MVRKIQITIFCLYNSKYVAIKIFAKNLELQPYKSLIKWLILKFNYLKLVNTEITQ